MNSFELKYKNSTFYGFSILFILLNSLVVYYFGLLYFSVLPIIFLIFVIGIVSYQKLFFLVAFFTPLSLSLSYFIPDIAFNFSIFTEPLLIFLVVILFYKFLLYHRINIEILTHPISVAVLFNLIWIIVTTITSTLPLVSLKFLISRLWFLIPMFLFGIVLFRETKNIKTFFWAYGVALFVVVIYSTYNLSQTSFLAKNAAHFAVKPFYNDHTAYGAILALFSPVFWGLGFNSEAKPIKRILAFVLAFSFSIGVVLSYSRAAWIGLVVAFGVWILVKLKIKFKYILTFLLLLGIIIAMFWSSILNNLEKNQQDSSSNISEHIVSMLNVSTDASNLERINRWHCALEMFKEKPVFGWGPGTFQFQYAPFQLERMRTIISTDFGDVGNAHSEYLGPLAEQGLLGFISILWLAISLIIVGLRIYKESKETEMKIIALSVTLGFITYFIHGLMNNFLDSDKLAIPFYAFAAIIVSLDLKNRNLKT